MCARPSGAVTLGAAAPYFTRDAPYWNPLSACSPFATAEKVIDTSSVLPAASLTVTSAVAVLESAVSGVPLITPVPVLRVNPDGRAVALYWSMSTPPLGFMALIASPTCNDDGAL